jgi:NAD(P)-dependent dehydrogenase (short-subunit alcohol dehydrogenase family)
MLLQGKTAIVYGAGPVGTAVARSYADNGAKVFLASRSAARLDAASAAIRNDSPTAPPVQTAVLDVTDHSAVAAHAAEIADASEEIDVVFNAVANDDVQGTPLTRMELADVLQPVTKALTAHFVISTIAAQHMIPRRAGVILGMAGGREAIPSLGGSHVAWSALAGLCRQLAGELSPHGIRVAWILSPGSPDPDDDPDPEAGDTLLNHRPHYSEVGAAAAFLASDGAAAMTATELNLTGGLVVD